jgi:uncharacterized membrane protein
MVKALVIATVAWPLLLGGALEARVHQTAPVFVTAIYVAASRVCHQKPERSFHTAGVRWPVCGRCSGLYLGGALGAIAAATWFRRRVRQRLLVWLAVAAVPTAVLFVIEKAGLVAVGNDARFLAAIPLGVFVALVIVRTAGGPAAAIE